MSMKTSKEPKVPNPVITYRGTVYPWHCDHVGHMNVMWYVGKFDEATWQLFSHLGLTNSRFQNEGRAWRRWRTESSNTNGNCMQAT